MNESKATRYQRLRRRAQATASLSAVLVLALVALTPLARWLRDVAAGLAAPLSPTLHVIVTFSVFILFVMLLWEAASFPSMVYAAVHVRSSKGQPVPTLGEILGAQVRSSLIALPIVLVAGAAVPMSVWLAGEAWWVLCGLTFGVALGCGVGIGPWLMSRLGTMRPMSRPSLVEALNRLAVRVRVPVSGIDEWVTAEGSGTSALVTGVGRTRRVLVSSELVRQYSDEEIAVVVAHELAHHAYHDLWRSLALNVIVLLVALGLADGTLQLLGPLLGLQGPSDLAALPYLGLLTSLVWVASTPLRHAQSRRHERRADVFALGMTGEVDAFRSALRRLSARHLAEERPSRMTRWLYHHHPSVAERLAVADAYSRVRNASRS
ncbi:MAG: M48 family metalloprotease [Vicinamibacterales bacterium]